MNPYAHSPKHRTLTLVLNGKGTSIAVSDRIIALGFNGNAIMSSRADLGYQFYTDQVERCCHAVVNFALITSPFFNNQTGMSQATVPSPSANVIAAASSELACFAISALTVCER